MGRIGRIVNPTVPVAPSRYAVPVVTRDTPPRRDG